MERLTSEQDRYNQTFGRLPEMVECVCGEYFSPEFKGQTGCCSDHEDAVECTNCEKIIQDSVNFKGLDFCDQTCISEWWHETAERCGEDR